MGSGGTGTGLVVNAAATAAGADVPDIHNFSIPLMTIMNLSNNFAALHRPARKVIKYLRVGRSDELELQG